MDKTQWLKYGNEIHDSLKELRRISQKYGVGYATINIMKSGILYIDAEGKEEKGVELSGTLKKEGLKLTVKDTTYIK